MENTRGLINKNQDHPFRIHQKSRFLKLDRTISTDDLAYFHKADDTNSQSFAVREFNSASIVFEKLPGGLYRLLFPIAVNEEEMKKPIESKQYSAILRSYFGNGQIMSACKSIEDIRQVLLNDCIDLMVEMKLLPELRTIAQWREKWTEAAGYKIQTDDEFVAEITKDSTANQG
jgi:hypothetical protein